MAFDQNLADRLEKIFLQRKDVEETRMFGGFGYLMNGNMCVGIHKEQLIVRVGKPAAAEILQEEYVEPMDITGRAMSGWARVVPEGVEKESDLRRFCQLAIDFVATLPAKPKKR